MRMRIISGKFKGRLIQVPQSKDIRPTTDRVRETLFNLLNNKLDFKGLKVLDLYSGSGSLGLECLSRGADVIHFVERNFFIYKNLVNNIASLKAENQCIAYKMEAVRYSRSKINKGYDLIIADPPFFKDDIYTVVGNLLRENFLNESCFMIVERSVQTMEKDLFNFKVEPFKTIGDACLYEIAR